MATGTPPRPRSCGRCQSPAPSSRTPAKADPLTPRARLVVVGLGPAGPELVTPATTAAIASVEPGRRWLRTTRHPAAAGAGIEQSFDDVYEAGATFDDV